MIAGIGDMLELGDETPAAHREAGAVAAEPLEITPGRLFKGPWKGVLRPIGLRWSGAVRKWPPG